MSTRVVLATRNTGKIAELQRILTGVQLDVELLGTAAFDDLPDIAETGATFADNALLKARAVSEHTGLPAIADDSGLCVDALNGMPGIFSARWSGKYGDDDANLDLLLAQLADVPVMRRGAQFVCAAALWLPNGIQRVVQGELAGTLLTSRRGTGGFGYDPIFVPTDGDQTTAEMSPDQKDAISHRGQAFRALASVLAELLTEVRYT